jgi:hypothetical protein
MVQQIKSTRDGRGKHRQQSFDEAVWGPIPPTQTGL